MRSEHKGNVLPDGLGLNRFSYNGSKYLLYPPPTPDRVSMCFQIFNGTSKLRIMRGQEGWHSKALSL